MKHLILAIVLFLPLQALAQTKSDKEQAREYGMEAIKKMDKQEFEPALELLEKAKQLDPDNPLYPYEMAYAYYSMLNYKKAAELLETVIIHKDATDQYYQLLGNAYDMLKKPEKALETYAAGMERFPSSGKLYLESGTLEAHRENYDKAIQYWEKGVQVAPKFPSNYYWLAKTFCSSDDKIWGVIYGEIFMNLERASVRTEEMSKLLYNTYVSAIKIKSKTEASVKFSKTFVMAPPKEGEEVKLSFAMQYEMNMIVNLPLIMKKKKVDHELINDLRTAFIKSWFERKFNNDYPNVLFDYQQKLMEKGQFEAYNYWLLMKGNQKAFDTWVKKNTDKYNEFIEWYKINPIQLSDREKFYRWQYMKGNQE